jgi:hypothetical protein
VRSGIKSESALEAAFAKHAREQGCLCYKFLSPGHRGVPDRIIICPSGHLFFIEFKSRSGRLSPWQSRAIARLRGQGQRVYIIDNLEDAKDVLAREISRVSDNC